MSKVLLGEVKQRFLLTLFFGPPEMGYRITCERCGYYRRIAKQEKSGAAVARALFLELDGGKIGVEEYLRRLDDVDFPTLQEYRADAKFWMCAACNEVVPDAMAQCWNCRTAKPGVELDAREAVARPIPHGVSQAAKFPWEV